MVWQPIPTLKGEGAVHRRDATFTHEPVQRRLDNLLLFAGAMTNRDNPLRMVIQVQVRRSGRRYLNRRAVLGHVFEPALVAALGAVRLTW